MPFALLLLIVAVVLLKAAFTGRSIPDIIASAVDVRKAPTFTLPRKEGEDK